MKADLEQTRKRGYSIDDAGTIARITPENERSLALELKDTAAEISAHLSAAASQSDRGPE